ncbi:MAG: hypothetical protein ACI8YQ_001216 [Polaribacter sp.]|jgi:hypothetical protein
MKWRYNASDKKRQHSIMKPIINTPKLFFKSLFLLLAFSSLSFYAHAQTDKQKLTKVKGVIMDAETKEPLPFVNVSFVGTTVGTTTDFDGKYSMSSQWASDQIRVSYVGYDDVTKPVVLGDRQTIDFEMGSGAVTLATATVKAKKGRYRKKNNPAVELIRKVMKNKDRNRIEGQDFYEYDKYEKVELDVNNITDKFMKRKVFNSFQFIFDHVDTSEINGKPFLPVYIQETSSKVFYRKNPSDRREHRHGVQMSGLDDYWDNEGVAALMDVLYQDIDIYSNKINIIDIQFISPLNPIGVEFYRYYIIDTVEVNGRECIDLAFIPRNKQNFGFIGNLFITNDSNYTVTKVKMGIVDQINMNWVEDLQIEQEFELSDSVWILNKDKFIIDFKVTKKSMGFFGRKNVVYTNHLFNTPRDNDIYSTTQKVKDDPDVFDRPQEFWAENRPVPLSVSEAAVYQMIDTIQGIPAFKNTMDVLKLVFTGYYTLGAVDVGPLSGIYSFNDVEGSRVRLGGETNLKFHKQLKLAGTALYAFKSNKWRYGAAVEYSFNKDFEVNPRHRIRVSLQHDSNFPGQNLNLVNEDNFLLSFKRGNIDKMILFDSYKVDYLKEFRSNFSYSLLYEYRKQKPLGDLIFNSISDARPTDTITTASVNTSEFGLDLRWAPNEQFVQGREFRYAIYNKYPVFRMKYRVGIDGLGGNYDYHRVSLDIFKKWNFSILGYAHTTVEVGKVFGSDVPYLMSFLARANQTYAYQTFSYNMMNFLEFINDEYVSANIRYYFNGFIFNKIPLLKKLKLREIVSFKMLYGRLTDKNNPDLNSDQIQFPKNELGDPTTTSLSREPYMEASVGISNIFKILTFDLVKRLNYLDNPNTPSLFGVRGLGIRFRAGLEF